MFQNYPDIVTPADLGRMLKIGKIRVYHLLESKQIKSIRIGKCYKIPKIYIIEFIERQAS